MTSNRQDLNTKEMSIVVWIFSWMWRLFYRFLFGLGLTMLLITVFLFTLGMFFGKMSLLQVADRLTRVSVREVGEGLSELAKMQGWYGANLSSPIEIPSPASTQSERWGQDLDYLESCIRTRHAIAWVYNRPDKFHDQIAKLKEQAKSLSDRDVVANINKTLATLGDGHTGIQTATSAFPFSHLPIRLKWFSDGLFVVAATSEHRAIVGHRVTHLEGAEIERIAGLLKEFFSSENEYADKANTEQGMECVDYLHAIGIVENPQWISMTLQSSTEGESVVQLAPSLRKEQSFYWGIESKVPMYQSDRDKRFWFKHLADDRALFIKYNQCADEVGFSLMVEEVVKVLEKSTIDRLIVDLRMNGGGNSRIINPLLAQLGKYNLDQRGKLFVLTDRNTFSSGFHALLTLRKYKAIHVGEPSSQKLNYGGDVTSFELPNSKVRVSYPTKDSAWLPGVDIRVVQPDLVIEPTSQDFFEGKDPVLEATLHWSSAS